MSDEERYSEEEEEESEDEGEKVEDTGPSEAELAMQRRREQMNHYGDIDDQTLELLEQARIERQKEADEIRELRMKRERRKKEREEEERRQAEKRAEEDARRKAEEEERRRKKDEEQAAKRAEREKKMAEQDKWKQPQGRNFVITKKAEAEEEGDREPKEEKKSKEQLEAEKQAILNQRIQPLNIDGMGTSQLGDKLKELHKQIEKLEGEKYDLEKRFKKQQYDMMELAERARQMNQVGRGGLKRIMMTEDIVDPLQARFAGCPGKIEMYSKYERQQDKREYGDRRTIFTGPQYLFPAERINATRIIKWNETTGLPTYEDIPGMEQPAEPEEEE